MNVRKFLSYHEAKEIVQKAGIKTVTEYWNWKERSSDIPAVPNITYKKEWNGWGEFLGTGNVSKKEFLSYKEAQKIVQQSGIKSKTEYRNWKEHSNNIPSSPDTVYKKEWKGWSEFLGTNCSHERSQ